MDKTGKFSTYPTDFKDHVVNYRSLFPYMKKSPGLNRNPIVATIPEAPGIRTFKAVTLAITEKNSPFRLEKKYSILTKK